MSESDSHDEVPPMTKKSKVEFMQHPNQAKNINFPVDSKNKRRFLPAWYQSSQIKEHGNSIQ